MITPKNVVFKTQLRFFLFHGKLCSVLHIFIFFVFKTIDFQSCDHTQLIGGTNSKLLWSICNLLWSICTPQIINFERCDVRHDEY